MSHSTQGVTVVHGGQDGATLQHLELLNVDIQVTIIDTAAHVVLSHVFENTLAEASGRCKLMLPVPTGAAVCAFQMETSDGKFVVGQVKEKSEAENVFATAVQHGQTAGLVNWAGDDVFTMSIGSISGRTSVIAKTTLVMSLMDDSSADEIRLVLPVTIGAQRYGLPLPEARDARHPQTSTRLRFTATVQSGGYLRKLYSPSHGPGMSVQFYRNHRGINSRHRAEVKMRSKTFLTSDLVLCAKADGLDAPRCFGEYDVDGGTVALQLSLAPNFEITRPPSQEFLFLVDCSGSMGPEGRIETAKRALTILLRILPNEGSSFNIFCFGSTCVSMWQGSRPYTQTNLNEASAYINNINSELGGTEINAAMRVVLASRNASVPTIVYALTDGEVQEIDATCRTVQTAVKSSNAVRAPVRAFTLGIGSTVSSALCEGVARAGHGVALFAVDASEIIAKCARLVGAGIHPTISDIRVDWGISSANATAAPVDSVVGTSLHPPPALQQTPQELTTIYRNHRFVVYAILRTSNVPKQVFLRGRVQNGALDHIEIAVPVRTAKKFSSASHMSTNSAFLHTLAARNLIRDLRDGSLAPSPVNASTPHDMARRAEIVRLGVRYQLVSEHTSFVGVDEGETVRRMERVWRERRRQHLGSQASQSSPDTSSWSGLAGAAFDWITGTFGWILSSGSSSSRGRMPGGYSTRSATPDSRSRTSSSQSEETQQDGDPADADSDIDADVDGYSTDRTFSSISSLESHSTINTSRRRRTSRRATRRAPDRTRERSPELRATSRPERAVPPPRPQPHADDLSLLTMQAFDGSFAPSDELSRIIGRDTSVEAAALGVLPLVWATARVLAYLEEKLRDQPDLLDVVRDKVVEYGAKAVGEIEFQRLLAEARASR
ncbi:hypothetical protein PENSPDRAFT_634703 [Peniophora sp. CONT]|nr:hypothetical protein PENSPDRAFT_634703 [Peniophora sp. CONT]